MNELKSKFINWWQERNAREKRILATGSIITAILILYFGILSPISDSLMSMRKQITNQEALLAFLKEADVKLKQQKGASTPALKIHSPVKMLTYVKKLLNESGLESQTKLLQQSGNDAVSLQLQNASFDKFVGLLTTVTKDQQIDVTLLDVSLGTSSGLVNIEMQFKFS